MSHDPTLETRRALALDLYGIMDTPREAAFDDLASLAAIVCRTPVAIVNFIHEDRQFFKAEVGLGQLGASLADAFCAHTLKVDDDLLVVPDATQDPRFADNPFVTGAPHLRFYAGAPLRTEEGVAIGALCVIDYAPRALAEAQLQGLRILARQVMAQLELRRAAIARDRESEALRQSRADYTESENRFRNMADHAPVMMWITDPDGFCTYLNRRWYEFTGQTEAEAAGFGWLHATHPDDKDEAGRIFAEANADRRPFRLEYRLRRADGSYGWAIDAASPRFGLGGQYLGYVGSVIDIQDRREAEIRLRESEEMLRLATDAAEIGMWDVDPIADTLFWPPRVKAMFGISPDVSVTMQDYYDGLHPDDFAHIAAAYASAADPERREVYDVEYRTVGKEDGVVRWVAAKGRGLFDEAGVCRRVIGTAIDITARKRTEQALRELNETLEQRVAETIAERVQAEEQLRQAQKMEAVGQLTGGIAHDFNNLLTGVIGSLDLMQRRISQGRFDGVERYAAAAVGSANRAAALTHRLLAFSRRQPLDPRPVQANRLVRGMEELLRRTLGERVRLEIVTAAGLWLTLCDPHQLENAILNLAINARDAMPDGGTLTIETCNTHLDGHTATDRQAQPGQYVCICVTDTGTGMSADIVDRAFEPFFTTKPIGQGTGLGLSMIYGFARQSEGYARIYSEVEQGTTVKLYLPRHYGEGEEVQETAVELDEDHRSEHGEVVLVVEDETAVRDLVVEVLRELGYRAIEAADGLSGLRLLQSDMRVDLVVTDVGLPGINGRQMIDAARDARPALRALFMTGYAENATLANGFLEPGMQMITKPFAVETLVTRIRAMLEAAGSTPPGSPR